LLGLVLAIGIIWIGCVLRIRHRCSSILFSGNKINLRFFWIKEALQGSNKGLEELDPTARKLINSSRVILACQAKKSAA